MLSWNVSQQKSFQVLRPSNSSNISTVEEKSSNNETTDKESPSSDTNINKNSDTKNKSAIETNYGSLNGIAGLSKSYAGRDKFSGKWEENLEESLVLYETLSKLCHLSLEEMSEGLPIMLTGDALSYYTMNIPTDENYKAKTETSEKLVL